MLNNMKKYIKCNKKSSGYSKPVKFGDRYFRYNYDTTEVEYVVPVTSEMLTENEEWMHKFHSSLYDIHDGFAVIDYRQLNPDYWENKSDRIDYLREFSTDLDYEVNSAIDEFYFSKKIPQDTKYVKSSNDLSRYTYILKFYDLDKDFDSEIEFTTKQEAESYIDELEPDDIDMYSWIDFVQYDYETQREKLEISEKLMELLKAIGADA